MAWTYDPNKNAYTNENGVSWTQGGGFNLSSADQDALYRKSGLVKGSEVSGKQGVSLTNGGKFDPNAWYRAGSTGSANGTLTTYYDAYNGGLQGVGLPAAPTDTEQAAAMGTANAKAFRGALPGLKQQMAESLTKQSALGLADTNRQIDESDSRRGLLYGGMNKGHRAAARSQSALQLASGINQGNTSLDQAANAIDQNAIGNAVAVQQTQQNAYNNAYMSAMSSMNAQNAMMGGMLSSAASIGLMAMMG